MVSYKRLNCLPKEVGGRGSIGSNVLEFCLFKKKWLTRHAKTQDDHSCKHHIIILN
jgi:hypothetical protein